MMSASTAVYDYVSNEQYLPQEIIGVDGEGNNIYGFSDTPSEITDKYICNQCLDLILDDLSTLGIKFHCDTEDLFNNLYDIFHVITLLEVMHPRRLSITLQIDKIVNKSIAEVMHNDPDTLAVVLVLYKLSESDASLSETYTFLYDKINNTGAYKDYTNNLLVMNRSDIPDLTNTELGIRLIEFVDQTRIQAKKIILAANKVAKVDIDFLLEQLEKYNADKIAPAHINKYCYWLQFKDTAKDPIVKSIVESIDKAHAIVNTHHIEYFERLEPSTISREQIVLLLANCFQPDKPNNKATIYRTVQEYKIVLEDKQHIVPEDMLTMTQLILETLGAV